MDQPLRNTIDLANHFVVWQSPYGAPDPVKCPYRTPGRFKVTHLHSVSLMARSLYRLYDETGVADYKRAADRYAAFFISTVHAPTVDADMDRLGRKRENLLSYAWVYGKALSPCYEWFVRHNPEENPYELKAHSFYQGLQRHRRDDSYFGVGYGTGQAEDAQFSCDLGEVGTGLVGYYVVSKLPEVLDDAIGLARFFLTPWQEGSGRGIWSSEMGVWLVGPWAAGGAEHMTDQVYCKTAWGWSTYVDGEFLLRLREHLDDPDMKREIDEKCNRAVQWCWNACGFDDGAVGMFGRDDKWVGMAAAALLLYLELRRSGGMFEATERNVRPKAEKTWRWLVEHTRRDAFPRDGYIQVTGTTTKKPLENLVWLMGWTVEALIEGRKVFEG